eukprot:3638651-Rhodomonas_salina.1
MATPPTSRRPKSWYYPPVLLEGLSTCCTIAPVSPSRSTWPSSSTMSILKARSALSSPTTGSRARSTEGSSSR